MSDTSKEIKELADTIAQTTTGTDDLPVVKNEELQLKDDKKSGWLNININIDNPFGKGKNAPEYSPEPIEEQKKNNTLFVVAGILVVIVVAILLIKKRK